MSNKITANRKQRHSPPHAFIASKSSVHMKHMQSNYLVTWLCFSNMLTQVIDLNIKQWNRTVFKYNLFVFLFTCIAVGYNWQWCLHCEELAFFYSHTHKEYNTCRWRLQYMLGTRYAQYMLRVAQWKRIRSLTQKRFYCTEIACLLQGNSWLLVMISVRTVWPTCVCSAKVWIGFSIGVDFVLSRCIIECHDTH